MKNHYEALMAQLEQTVEKLENGQLALDESVKAFEEGMELVKKCQKMLDVAQGKLEKVISDQGERAPLTDEADEHGTD